MENRVQEASISEIRIVPAYAFPRETAELFEEYTKMPTEGENGFRRYLEMWHYADELKDLEIRPAGRTSIPAYCGGKAAGCIGPKRLDSENCEMKRLYVRPKFRGEHIGNAFVQRIIGEAGESGYRHMLLDTLAFLRSAIQLYQSWGFYETESYNESPAASSAYMKPDL